jgi:signal transduction histidine kinase
MSGALWLAAAVSATMVALRERRWRKRVERAKASHRKAVELEAELRRRNRHLSLLNEISSRVAESGGLQHTLETVLDEVIKSFAISGGGIFLLHDKGSRMSLALHRNIPDKAVEELSRIQPGMGLAGKVAETGRPRLSVDLRQDHRRISSAVFSDGWRAFLAVPFIAEETVMGVLFVFDRGELGFRREDVRLLQAVGLQTGPILQNAELLDELQWQQRINLAGMREVERSRAILSDNLQQLEQHHRTLQGLNRMKSSFLSLASHELRTPLTTILSGAEFLQQTNDNQRSDNSRRALDLIIRSSNRLNHIVDDLLEAARLEAKSLYMAREAFEPKLMIEALTAELEPSLALRKLQLEIAEFPEQAAIRGDSAHLKRALDRLLENAIKFTPAGGRIVISGRALSRSEVAALSQRLSSLSGAFFDTLAERYLEIAVTDDGVGLDEEDQLRIFDKFHEIGDISGHSSSKAAFGGKGIGLGLTLVKGVIEIHDGLVWAESEGPGQGSRFAVLLPLLEPDEEKNVLG